MAREIVVDTATYTVSVDFLRVEMSGGAGDQYEWVASNGQESRTLFETLEEAQENAGDHFG